MLKTRVGVLRGGASSEYEVSLKTGKAVLDNLPDDHYQTFDIFIDKNGVWHRSGIPRKPHQALQDVDVVFNALHGEFGEDGKLQTMLDNWGIPYTGSGALASALGMNKILTKKSLVSLGIKTPIHRLVKVSPELPERLHEIFRTFPHPSIVKPYNSGSSRGVSLVSTYEELERGVASAFEYSPQVLIEEYINGKEGSLGVIENFRNKEYYALLPVEIKKKENEVFGYDEKYNENSHEICPGNFSKQEIIAIEESVINAHRALNARHYSRTDFIVHPKRGVFVLEVNTLPGLADESIFPKSLKALGIKIPDFLHHLVTEARK